MYCQQCGAEIPTGQNVCPKCYASVRKPGLLSRLFGWLIGPPRTWPAPGGPSGGTLRSTVSQTTTRIEMTDPATGEKRVFNSLEEAPPEIRARIEAMRAGGGDVQTRQAFTIRDASGQERTYHSVDEMPPEVRAIYDQVRRRGDGAS